MHKDEQCDGLHTEIDYSIRTYRKSKGSETLFKWFNEVFTIQHPELAGDFFLENKQDEGNDILEVMAMNPFFSIDALEALFEADRAKPKVAPLKAVSPNLN